MMAAITGMDELTILNCLTENLQEMKSLICILKNPEILKDFSHSQEMPLIIQGINEMGVPEV